MIEAIGKLVKGQHLSEQEAGEAFEVILAGDATPSQIAGFVIALRIKGETAEEIAGLARAARAHATPLEVGSEDLLDTCEPAVTRSAPSTSRPSPRSSPPPAAPGSPSMATGPPPRSAAAPTCSKRWA